MRKPNAQFDVLRDGRLEKVLDVLLMGAALFQLLLCFRSPVLKKQRRDVYRCRNNDARKTDDERAQNHLPHTEPRLIAA